MTGHKSSNKDNRRLVATTTPTGFPTDAALLSVTTRRRIARRGGGVRDVSSAFSEFMDFFNAHYTQIDPPSKKKGRAKIHVWRVNDRKMLQSAYAKAQKDFKGKRGYAFYDIDCVPQRPPCN